MSYWAADSVVQIGEEQVEIPAERGLSYEVGSVSRKVVFQVPQSIGFFSGKDSYLTWDMKIKSTSARKTRLQLDPAGCGMCVETCRIMCNGVVLEEITDCNQLVAMKYDYDKDQSLQKHRAVMEGATAHSMICAGTRGSSKSDMCDTQTNPWFKQLDEADPADDYDQATDGLSVKCCVPMFYSGIFSGGVFPVMLLENGLTIELDLAPAPSVVRQLDSVVMNRRRTLNPVFQGTDAAGAAWGNTNANADVPVNAVYLQLANNCNTRSKCPFVRGEHIGFVEILDPAADPVVFERAAAPGVAVPSLQITNIEIDGGLVKLSFDAALNRRAAGDGGRAITSGNFAVVSLSAQLEAGYDVKYQVDNLNLVVHKLELEQEQVRSMLQEVREGSSVEFDIHSFTNYKSSMLKSDRQGTIRINAKNERAKALLTIPTDSSIYQPGDLVSSKDTYEVTRDDMDTRLTSHRTGISGCNDYLSEYQLQISGVNVPSRPVSTRKIATRKSIDSFFLFELEKALANSHIQPKSFSKFMENFVIGRSFGTSSGVMDLRNEDLTLQLRYGETTAPTKDKMFSSFVSHIRRLRIKDGYCQVDI
jgi:hypothetical protein